MKTIFYSFLAVIVATLPTAAGGQGCSDAGFCTISSIKPVAKDENPQDQPNLIKIGISNGRADHAITIYGAYLEYDRQIGSRFGLDVKLSGLAQTGNGASSIGTSDVYLNGNYAFSKAIKLILGAKFPLRDGNGYADGKPFPMDYQSSLGTVDLIAGVGLEWQKIQFVAAVQEPMTQNKNQFQASQYPVSSPLSAFQSTNKFERSGDVLLRVSYPVRLGEKFKITPSILPVYHLASDRFTDESGAKKTIEGSQGLTLNGNLYADFEINQWNFLQLNVGLPFVTRKARPDGLTRSYVVTLEYSVKF